MSSNKPQKPNTKKRNQKNEFLSDDPMQVPDLPDNFQEFLQNKLKQSAKGLEDMKAMAKRKQLANMSMSASEFTREKMVDGTCSKGTYLVIAKSTDGPERFVSMRYLGGGLGEIRVHLHPSGEKWPMRHLPLTFAGRRSQEGHGHDSFRLQLNQVTEFFEDLWKMEAMSVMPEDMVREKLAMPGATKRGTNHLPEEDED